MAASYDLITSRPSIQVMSPTTRLAVQVCTIKTKPSGVIADLWVDRKTFTRGGAGAELSTFADNIEAILSLGKAVGGVGDTSLDDNGLQQVYVTFTVAYVPPGPTVGSITTDVDVLVGLLSVADAEIGRTLMSEAEAQIDAAYDQLVAAANG